MEDKNKIVVIAVFSLVLLEVLAILKHIDGIILSLVIAAIAGLAGYEMKNK